MITVRSRSDTSSPTLYMHVKSKLMAKYQNLPVPSCLQRLVRLYIGTKPFPLSMVGLPIVFLKVSYLNIWERRYQWVSASIIINHLFNQWQIYIIFSIDLQLFISFLPSVVPPNFLPVIVIIQRALIDGMACQKESIFPTSSSANFHTFIKPTTDTCPIDFSIWR